MSELGDIFRAMKELGKQKRENNWENGLRILAAKKVPFQVLDEYSRHIRVSNYDFWASTGLYIHRETKRRGRGIFNLLKVLRREGVIK